MGTGSCVCAANLAKQLCKPHPHREMKTMDSDEAAYLGCRARHQKDHSVLPRTVVSRELGPIGTHSMFLASRYLSSRIALAATPGSHAATRSCIVLALKSGYYLDGEKATLISAADDIRILAYAKARSG
jgi:hypothetical protein